ncbi:hypothetical protein ATCC90586_011892 [Pythium insidiosum]|nr:hypothetical protein ATCC90586_011892 [Pythium insidiosum]
MIAMPPCAEPRGEYLPMSRRIGVFDWAAQRAIPHSYVLLDTRTTQQFEMVHFPEAVNTPFETLLRIRRKQQFRQYIVALLPYCWQLDCRLARQVQGLAHG